MADELDVRGFGSPSLEVVPDPGITVITSLTFMAPRKDRLR